MAYLDEQLCVQMYIQLRSIIRMHEKRLRTVNLTYPKALVLLALDELSPCCIDVIAKRLILDTGTLTPVLKTLEKMKDLVKKRDIHDERKILLTLTAQGREKIGFVKEKFSDTAQCLSIPDHEKERLLKTLHLLNFNLGEKK